MFYFKWGVKPWQQPEHPVEKCPSNNCHWLFWACSIMSGAFSRQWQSRVGPLVPLCTTFIWWIKAWANGRGTEGCCTVKPRPDERESVCARSFVSTGGLWHLPTSVPHIFPRVYRLEPSLIEKNYGDFDSLFMNNSSIALWITNQWSEVHLHSCKLLYRSGTTEALSQHICITHKTFSNKKRTARLSLRSKSYLSELSVEAVNKSAIALVACLSGSFLLQRLQASSHQPQGGVYR